MNELKIEYIPISGIKQYKNNAKEHPNGQVEQIAKSIEQFGFNDPIAIDETDTIIEGHGRLLAVKKLIKDGRSWANKDTTKKGEVLLPIIRLNHLDDQAKKAYILAHNKLTMNSGFDLEILNAELADITDFNMGDFGFTEKTVDEEIAEKEQAAKEELSLTFTVPPVTVLDTRTELWQKRRNAWDTLIREPGVVLEDSTIDAVLAEILVQWFTPLNENGRNVYDPFAGGAEVGFVASYMGKKYVGIDIRQEQVDANENTLSRQNLGGEYICDNGENIGQYIPNETQDLLITSPPYYDTHITSNDERDASNQKTYEEFYQIVDAVYTAAAKCLRENRFAIVIVQNVRNRTDASYYDLVADTKATFKRNGFVLYNELVLIKSCDDTYGDIEMNNRRVKKTNEDVLVFFKGDANKIKDQYGTDFQSFLINRENTVTDEKVLVFYKGDTGKIKEEYGQVETPVSFEE